MLLLIPGLAWFVIQTRTSWQPGLVRRALAGALLTAVAIAPVAIWNLQHQNAGLSHLLGYLAIPAGDRPIRGLFSYDPRWTAEFVLAQVAIVGPLSYVLFLSVRQAALSTAMRFATCCALPTLAVFLLFTFRSTVEANWTAAAYVSLLPAAACVIAERAHPRALYCWRGAIAYGVVVGLLIHAPLVAASVPLAGRFVPTHRFRGFADTARDLARTRPRVSDESNTLIVVPSHNMAGLLAFYLPGRPAVASAGRFFGNRPSAYDYFADTNLAGPLTFDRAALLIGASEAAWKSAFVLEGLTLVSPSGPQWLATSFRGPRPVPCDGC
jgi:hypothetical protein